jgi:hypothetical protein
LLVARIEVLGEVDARGAVRFTVDSESTVRGMNGEPVDVAVENFSRTGFLFSGDADLPLGTLLSVGLSGAGTREASVVWRDGARHGCVFLVPIAQRDIEKAFRGQQHVLADLEAALGQRSEAPVPPQPEPPLPPPRRPRWRLARLWRR